MRFDRDSSRKSEAPSKKFSAAHFAEVRRLLGLPDPTPRKPDSSRKVVPITEAPSRRVASE